MFSIDLTKILFFKRLINISRSIVEVLNDKNLFTESLSERTEAARWCEKTNLLKSRRAVIFHLDYLEKACQDHATLVIFNNSLNP